MRSLAWRSEERRRPVPVRAARPRQKVRWPAATNGAVPVRQLEAGPASPADCIAGDPDVTVGHRQDVLGLNAIQGRTRADARPRAAVVAHDDMCARTDGDGPDVGV